MEKVKNLFDEFYIVCTDYNGRLSKQIKKERREKDPILFGAFLDRNNEAINERFYYIGSWVDEYCDLTLDKMVAEMKNIGKDICNEIEKVEIPDTLEELQKQLDSLELEEEEIANGIKVKMFKADIPEIEKKKGLFSRIKTFLGEKK